MKVTLAMVMSADGKITRGDDPDIYSWTSQEDQAHFLDLKAQHQVIVMGSETYRAAKKFITLDEKTLRVVLTSTPDMYKNDQKPGKLEFSSLETRLLMDDLYKKGYKSILLVGGGKINANFFKNKLINEIALTIEPILFGKGKDLIAKSVENVKLKLQKIEQLNKKGTLLFHYTVYNE